MVIRYYKHPKSKPIESTLEGSLKEKYTQLYKLNSKLPYKSTSFYQCDTPMQQQAYANWINSLEGYKAIKEITK